MKNEMRKRLQKKYTTQDLIDLCLLHAQSVNDGAKCVKGFKFNCLKCRKENDCEFNCNFKWQLKQIENKIDDLNFQMKLLNKVSPFIDETYDLRITNYGNYPEDTSTHDLLVSEDTLKQLHKLIEEDYDSQVSKFTLQKLTIKKIMSNHYENK